MAEIVTLTFKDGSVFHFNTRSVRDCTKLLKLQKNKGDPVKIEGEGQVAEMFRKRYELYNKDKANYHMDFIGTASALSGIGTDKIKEDLKNKLGRFARLRE
jgi:hypothetical protein